ncbi:MAG: hypothetical protein AB8B86_15625 [Pseudomonadales bacterium]
MKKSLILILLAISAGWTMPSFGQPPAGWAQGAIDAIHLEQRQIVVSEQTLRVALRASISDSSGAKLKFEDLDISYAIAYQTDPSTGDILDLQVVAYP